MSRTLALSDSHGNMELFNQVLNYLQPDDTVYFLGDAIDRLPDGWKILNIILKDKRFKMLCGNHEDMMYKAYRKNKNGFFTGKTIYSDEMSLWFYNGGDATYTDILNDNIDDAKKILEIVGNLPTEARYINPEGKIIYMSHAGVVSDTPEDYNSIWGREDRLWSREHFYEDWQFNDNEFIIHGHTPVIYLFDYLRIQGEEIDCAKPYAYCGGHKIDIDCGAHFMGATALINLDTFEIISFGAEEDVKIKL